MQERPRLLGRLHPVRPVDDRRRAPVPGDLVLPAVDHRDLAQLRQDVRPLRQHLDRPRLDQLGVEPVLHVAALRVHEVGLEPRGDLGQRLLVGLQERELQRVVGPVRPFAVRLPEVRKLVARPVEHLQGAVLGGRIERHGGGGVRCGGARGGLGRRRGLRCGRLGRGRRRRGRRARRGRRRRGGGGGRARVRARVLVVPAGGEQHGEAQRAAAGEERTAIITSVVMHASHARPSRRRGSKSPFAGCLPGGGDGSGGRRASPPPMSQAGNGRLTATAGGRFTAGMIRTGDEYRESIRDGREVWIDGERVDDVTDAPGVQADRRRPRPHLRHGARGGHARRR